MSYRMRSWARARWRVMGALGLVVAIAGGGALILVAGALRTVSAPDRYSSGRAERFDVTIEQAGGAPRTAELEALPATESIETVTFLFGAVMVPGSEAPVDAIVFAGSQGPVGSRLVDGREADPARPDEFVASRPFVESAGARIGDRFDLVVLTQAQADESGFDADVPPAPLLTATLVGVVDGPGDLSDDYLVTLFPSALLDQGDIGVALTVAVASLAEGATVEDLRGQLDGLPDGDQFNLAPAELITSDVRAAVNAEGQGLVILGAIVFVAAVVVLGQLLSRQLRLDDAERTVLRSIGLSRAQVTGEPVGRAALAVVVGTVVAVALAYLCSGLFPLDFVRRVEPHPGRRFDPMVHGLGPVLFAVALLAWVVGATVVDSRAPRGSRPATLADRLAAMIPSGQVSTALRFAFTPSAHRARSVIAPLIGLTLVFCVLFGALTFGANLVRLVDEPSEYGVNFDLALGAGATDTSAAIRQAMEGSPDVDAVTLYGTTTVAIGAASLDIVGMQPLRGDLAPEVRRGRLPQGDDEIALGSVVLGDLGLDLGDELVVTGATGPRPLHVTGVALVPPVGGAVGVGESGVVTLDGFLAIDPSAGMNTAAVRLAADAPVGATDRIAALVGSPVGQTGLPSSILNLQRVRTIPFLVAWAVGALAMLSLGHLMIVAVRRRRNDLAILRALGATTRWLNGVVHWQATIITVVVLVMALPIGGAIGSSLYRALVDNVGARPDVVIPLAWLGLTLLALVAAANLVAAVPARRAAREAPAFTLTQA